MLTPLVHDPTFRLAHCACGYVSDVNGALLSCKWPSMFILAICAGNRRDKHAGSTKIVPACVHGRAGRSWLTTAALYSGRVRKKHESAWANHAQIVWDFYIENLWPSDSL